MKVAFEGYYGFQNTGDDAFVEVCAWGARQFWKSTENFFVGKNLPQTVFPIQGTEISMKGGDRLRMLQNIMKSDYFVSAGGSTLMELPFHSNKALAKYSKTFFKQLKTGAIGVSLGPFSSVSKEKETVKYLQALDFLALRDKRSYDYAKSLNLPYTPIAAFDLAALMPQVYENQPSLVEKSSVKTIGISVNLYESFEQGGVEKETKRLSFFKELVELINKRTSVHFKVFIINGNTNKRELETSRFLMSNVSEQNFTIIPYNSRVKKTWDEISSCDAMISTRLHASIFACYAKVPFFLIEYHQKCTDFLMDIGQNEKYRFYDGDVSPSEACEAVGEVLSGKYLPPQDREKTISLAKKNFTHTL